MLSWFFTKKFAKITRVILLHADVVELVDTLALGASAARREGSSPFIRTNPDFYTKGLLITTVPKCCPS